MFNISCIIVTHENEETIGNCLNSLIAGLNHRSGEIIVIDNASQDKTLFKARKACTSCHLQFRIIENVFNLGFTRAINQGLAASNGEFVLLLNPDTIIQPGFFEKMVSHLRENPDVGIVAPQHMSVSGIVVHSCREFPTHLSLFFRISGLSAVFHKSRIFNRWKMGYFDHRTSRVVHQPMGACIMTRRTDIQKIGYMDEQFRMFFSDVDWCRRFLIAGKRSYYLAEAKIIHYIGYSVRQMPVRMLFASHRAFSRYFWKYYNGWYWFVPNVISSIVLMISACVRVIFLPFRRK